MTEEYLFSIGYKKTEDHTYEKIDKKTGMSVELEFNPNTSQEESDKIIDDIIRIVARRN